MGLLEYVSTHALDEDYAFASRRRESAPGRRRRRSRLGSWGAAALAAFSGLVVLAAMQTSQGAAADAENRAGLADQVAAQRERLAQQRERLAELEAQTRQLQDSQLAGDGSASELREEVESLGLLTGALPVRGPGVQVVADDAPASTSDRTRVLDSDLQRLANGFWSAGAEAISINGQRLTNLSTIRFAGDAITVNARSLSPPFTLRVIGDPDTLPARFAETASGQAWLDLQRQLGIQLTITPRDELTLPASRTSLRFAESQAREEGETP